MKDLEEEYYRRMIVKLIKEAGTLIRVEVVKRHALTAEINLHYAESLRNILREDYDIFAKPLEDVLKEGLDRLKKGENKNIVAADMLLTLTRRYVLFSQRRISEIVEHIKAVNNFITLVNKIIEELNKEGIYLDTIEPVTVPILQDDYTIARILREALNRLDMAIGILKGLSDIANEWAKT
ncbi:MAG: hypothetical protein QXN97_06860 [Desulfurococcaceae archaeon]